jgi:hypothetical protein
MTPLASGATALTCSFHALPAPHSAPKPFDPERSHRIAFRRRRFGEFTNDRLCAANVFTDQTFARGEQFGSRLGCNFGYMVPVGLRLRSPEKQY